MLTNIYVKIQKTMLQSFISHLPR